MKSKRRKLTTTLISSGHRDNVKIVVTGPQRQEHMPKLSKEEHGMIDIVPCIDMETGEEAWYLGNTIFSRILEKMPDAGVGHAFEIINQGMHENGYRLVDVYELEHKADDDASQED